jgi:hypothetical protein
MGKCQSSMSEPEQVDADKGVSLGDSKIGFQKAEQKTGAKPHDKSAGKSLEQPEPGTNSTSDPEYFSTTHHPPQTTSSLASTTISLESATTLSSSEEDSSDDQLTMPGSWPASKKKKSSGSKKKKKKSGKKITTTATNIGPTAPNQALEQTSAIEEVGPTRVVEEAEPPGAEDTNPAPVVEEDAEVASIKDTEQVKPAAFVEGDIEIAPSEDNEQVTTFENIKRDQTADNTAPTTHPQLPTIIEEDETTPTREPKSARKTTSTATEIVPDPEKTPTRAEFPFRPAVNAHPASPTASHKKFQFDNFHPETRCRNPECRKSTHPLDGSTKICPACGPRSKVRYCSKACLYLDIRRHFFNECGTLTIEGEIDETGLDDSNKNVRPYIRHSTHELVNTGERHRQAVYFAMESEGEYFIFDDVEEAYKYSDDPSREQCQEARGMGRLVYTVVAPDERTRRNCNGALGHSLSRGANGMFIRDCATLAGLIIKDLQGRGEYSVQMCTYLCMQLGFETGYQVPIHLQVF